jgi:tryptophan 2,3-dioxygenase
MNMSQKEAYDLLEELLKAESKLLKWRQKGVGIVMTKETYKTLSGAKHPKKDFVLQGVLVERRGKLRF